MRIIKLSVTFLIFVLSLFIANALLNKGSNDMTQEMAPASLPIIYMNVNDEYINPLHGYTQAMEGNYLRGTITPLMANRSISFRADLYDAVIAKVGYEVRPLDMSRLIEDTELENFTFENNEIYATITLKDLIEDDVEYMLIIKLTTSSGEVIRYYARVMNKAELSIGDKTSFVRDFSAKTFNRDTAEELRTYMESNAEGDNSSYGYVNIHSSFKQLIWGDLAPMLKTNKDLELLEIDKNTASIRLSYQVEINNELHNVSEFFRIQKGDKRMYLLEYERVMDQVFDEEKNVIVNGKILHGIIHDKLNRIENDYGTIVAFEQQNALYSYNISTNTLARLFSFYDKENNDTRTRYNAHEIKPLEIDGVGNVRFIVYGYMNRGVHEGEVGVALYYYDCSLNTIEEELFIPYYKSSQILEEDINRLSYLSTRGQLYLLLDGAIYNVDINSRTATVMQDSISETNFFSSENQRMIAWQDATKAADYKQISLYRLDTMVQKSIDATSNEIVVPLGFMDSDIVYGVARVDDLTTDETGRTMIPMYSIRIQDETGAILKDYKQQGVYILSVKRQDNMLILTRVEKSDDGSGYVYIDEDQIVNNKADITMKNKLGSVVTDDTETTYQTILYKSKDSDNLKITNPKEVVYEEDRSIALAKTDELTKYYSYAGGNLAGIYTEEADAVISSQEAHGVVVDKRMAYVWETENRLSSTKINNLDIDYNDKTKTENVEESSDSDDGTEEAEDIVNQNMSYAKCLDVMLKQRGVYKDTATQLRNNTVFSVLSQDLKDCTILDLAGCNLSAVLYYVSRGYPVLAATERGKAVLIIGYDSKNTILYDPERDEVYKYGLNDSMALFEKNGNKYITYIE